MPPCHQRIDRWHVKRPYDYYTRLPLLNSTPERFCGRKSPHPRIVAEINKYYRTLGVEEENLVDVGDKPHQIDTALLPRQDTAN